ncbi:methylated-DNA--[protein]-cysteine S-methyltransferase [Roseateles sp. SL47]|uniref:methylated-DNA--[protein]-cysteine S-methyltransferase n=1 Tax=Roseateles sp. SL47 TaxID=2995138 RepID=UPI002D1E3BCE|nr:methylated-DNA--[protein]-cysteine S-methyltransferase [Roseateles sp. SL47]
MSADTSACQTETDTPLGRMLFARNGQGLCGLWFEGQKYHPGALAVPRRDQDPLLRQAVAAVQAYFAGQPFVPPPLSVAGTPFQQAVWSALLQIPTGVTCSYGDLATRLGRPEAVRAVAAAVGRNPLSLLVPCHRVMGANGQLTGYAGGLERKRALLALEARLKATAFTLSSPSPAAAVPPATALATTRGAAKPAPDTSRRPVGATDLATSPLQGAGA